MSYNDPLGQPTVPAGSDCRLILKFWDGRTDGHSVWKQWSLPAVTLGWQSGSITITVKKNAPSLWSIWTPLSGPMRVTLNKLVYLMSMKNLLYNKTSSKTSSWCLVLKFCLNTSAHPCTITNYLNIILAVLAVVIETSIDLLRYSKSRLSIIQRWKSGKTTKK